jgi:serine phosphatase RsbU (regulator of sigma subunit)
MIPKEKLLPLAVLTTAVLMILSCGKATHNSDFNPTEIDSTIRSSKDTTSALHKIDSMKADGTIGAITANYYKARIIYSYKPKYTIALVDSILAYKAETEQDRFYHFMLQCHNIDIDVVNKYYELGLREGQQLVDEADLDFIQSHVLLLSSYVKSLSNMAVCNIYLERYDKAEELLNTAIGLIDGYNADPSRTQGNSQNMKMAYRELCMHAMVAFANMKQLETGKVWMTRLEQLIEYLEKHPDALEVNINLYKQQLLAIKSEMLQATGHPEEAAKVFAEYQKLPSYNTPIGRINSLVYLIHARRFDEAIANSDSMDDFFRQRNVKYNLEILQGFVKMRFDAFMGAGRRDSALAVATRIIGALDSARVWVRRDKTMEMATLYDFKAKDAEIAEQKASLMQTRVIALLVAIVLLTVFFIVYSLLRRRAAKMKVAQQRIEGELQIARDIQMSMVPHTFPHREGLDMYASMTPAKEVGGDLYGYVVRNNMLYFAVGDVSGKGVPASLFMAQATRLFQTMANQGMLPAEICTRMNTALGGEDNVNGMFVTMFVGLLNMETGHLNFCNAGHNPPVIGGGANHGEFMQMESNAPIGLWPDLQYVGEEIDSVKGRPLFIYTDGLNEAEDPEQRQFGDERLLDILRNTHFDTAQQVIETLAAEVEAHRNGAEPNDDLTMMCLRVTSKS